MTMVHNGRNVSDCAFWPHSRSGYERARGRVDERKAWYLQWVGERLLPVELSQT
jgi:hypothetical protein